MVSVNRFKCYGCRKQFSIKQGTILEDSPTSLTKWIPAFWLLTGAKNGISSCELSRTLGVTQKTAWFMLHRIRHIMATGSFEKMVGTCEADETYLDKYIDEQAYRFNGRKATDSERFVSALRLAAGKRLTYDELTSAYETYFDQVLPREG